MRVRLQRPARFRIPHPPLESNTPPAILSTNPQPARTGFACANLSGGQEASRCARDARFTQAGNHTAIDPTPESKVARRAQLCASHWVQGSPLPRARGEEPRIFLAQAIILSLKVGTPTHQLSMYRYFFPVRGSGGALDFNPAAIHLLESAGSITSSTPKCDALLIAFPR
jgi:hypothetical protein